MHGMINAHSFACVCALRPHLPYSVASCRQQVEPVRAESDRVVTVTRQDLAERYDHLYDDDFSWLSERGERRFAALRGKTVLVARHCESTYQVLRETGNASTGGKLRWEDARGRKDCLDAPLSGVGRCQASHLGTRLALCGFQPDLILSSPLTRCLQTASLAFPAAFTPVALGGLVPRLSCEVKMSHLLPEAVDSWADCGRPIDDVIADGNPDLERFRGAMSASRFQRVGSDPNAALRPRRWDFVTETMGADGVRRPLEVPFPQEPRRSAQLRAALVWRLLSENRPERRVFVVTHSKLVKEDSREGFSGNLLGPGIREFKNGEFALVVFEEGE